MPPQPKIHGNAVYVPEGMPEQFEYKESHADTIKRLKACKVRGSDGWLYAREKMAETGLFTGMAKEESKVARFQWHRLHFPPLAVHEQYRQFLENIDAGDVNAEVPPGPEGTGTTADGGIEEDAANVPSEETPQVEQNLEVVAVNPPSAVSSGGEAKIKVEGFKPSAPLDPSMDIDRSVPSDWTLERFLSVALWTTQNAQHVLTGRVKLRHCPWPEAWFFVEVALSNPAQFLSRVAEKVIEYDRAKSAEAKAERGKLVDDGGKLSVLLRKLEKAEPVA